MIHADICLEIRPLDCFRILVMLNSKGLDNAEIARIVGVERSTVRYWKLSKRHPHDPFGRRLTTLFELYFPNCAIPQQTSDENPPSCEVAHI